MKLVSQNYFSLRERKKTVTFGGIRKKTKTVFLGSNRRDFLDWRGISGAIIVNSSEWGVYPPNGCFPLFF